MRWEQLRLLALVAFLVFAALHGAGLLFIVLGAGYLMVNLGFLFQLGNSAAGSRLTESEPLST
jgi:hypothetical protein